MRLLLRSFLLTFLAVTFSSLNVFSQTATIATDQPDYAPGSTAYITGTGWQPGETVTLQVLHDPTGGDDSTSPAHQPWTVVADGSGNVSSSWYVPGDADELGATLKLTADGGSSGLSASWIFTDNFTIYPDGISINSTSAQSLCVGTSANQLTATIQTCSNGGGVTGTQTAITYKWYYNTTASNNIVGATLVNTTTTTTATTTDSYIPSTTASDIGSRYYFCQVTFVPQGNGNACGGSGRSGYPYTTSTDQVTVTAFPNSPTAVNYSSAYDGQSHTASATAGTGETVDWYTTSTGSTTTAAPTGTNVGTYSAYAEARNTTTGCISSSRTLVSVTISKANPKVTVTPYSVPYDGQTHTATYSITGVNGETGATVGTIDVSATNHTNAGTYNGDAWSFTGAANYNNTNGTVNDAIAKVDPVITVTRYSVTYDGNAHTATFSVTGVKGETLSGMDVSATTHTNAGSYTSDLWKFTDVTGNYNDKSAPVDDEIAKADPTITVTPYSVAYDGNAHTATFTAVGVETTPVDLTSLMTVTGTTHTNAGDYPSDAWSFAGNGNYNTANGTVHDQIAKADPVITVTPYSVTYDGNPHTATFSVTGVKGETLLGMDVSATTHTDAGSYTTDPWKFTDVTGNYNDKSATVDDEIAKADPTITVTPYSVTYDGNAHTATFTAVGVEPTPVDLTSLMSATGTTHTNAGDYPSDAWSFAGNGNYNTANGTVHDVIAKRTITITPDAGQFKYCGQSDPTFTYTASEDLITGNSYSGAIARLGTNDVGTYSYTIGTLSAGTNYTLTLGGSNTFEIKGVSIDASNTSTAIQLGTATKQLAATVTSGTTLVNNATVTFTVTNNGNITPITVTDVTDASGVATYNLPSGSLGVGLYQVTAVAGSGCATSVAYFSVYDPNAGFVTGGGWIVSPPGAYSPDHTLTGKANFGFNSQYKKGSNVPTGNTQFQFQAGNLNFNSSSYNSGSLVIAGAKAVFQGVGTINGSGNYNFMISAIDGSISGGGGVDKFRIKIWTSDGKGVVYDNNSGNDNNADPTTALGGGSIVIHSTSSKSSRIMSPTTSGSALEVNSNQASNQTGTGPLTIKVLPNPTSYYFTAGLQSLSKYNVNLVVTDITGRVIEQRTNIAANSTIQFGSSYHPGTYIAQFMQGNDKVTIRLIKEGE